MKIDFNELIYFKDNGYILIGMGYMHLIFEKDNKVFKVNRNIIANYSDIESLYTEMRAMNFLRRKGYPIPIVYQVYEPGVLIPELPVLVEEKIDGKLYTRENINSKCIMKIFEILEEISKISMPAGYLFKEGCANKQVQWRNFIQQEFIKMHEVIEECQLIDYSSYVENVVSYGLDNQKVGYLILDPNEQNFFFNELDEIKAIIDIDHPVGGELFYQWGCYMFHRPEQFKLLAESKKYSINEMKRIEHFALLHAYTDLYFRMKTEQSNIKKKEWIKLSTNFIQKIGDKYGYM